MYKIFLVFLSIVLFTLCDNNSSSADENPIQKGTPRINVKIENADDLIFDLYFNGFYILNEKTKSLSNRRNINQYFKNDNNVFQITLRNYPYKEPDKELILSIKSSLKTIFTVKVPINSQNKSYTANILGTYEGAYIWQNAEQINPIKDQDTEEITNISKMYLSNIVGGTPENIGDFFEKYKFLNSEFYASIDKLPKPSKQAYQDVGSILYDILGAGGGESRTIEYNASIENIVIEVSPYDNRIVIVREKSRNPVLDIRYGEDGKVLGVLIEPALNFLYYDHKWQLY